jgi:hypothetical protein
MSTEEDRIRNSLFYVDATGQPAKSLKEIYPNADILKIELSSLETGTVMLKPTAGIKVVMQIQNGELHLTTIVR